MLRLSALSALLALALSLELVNAHAHHAHHHHKRQNVAIASGASSTGVAVSASSTATLSPSPPTAAAAPSGTGPYDIPPLSAITSGMTGATPTLATTYTAGALPTYSGAVPLPSAFVFNAADWPALDVIPPTDSPQVQEWIKLLDGVNIPNITPTNGSECDLSPVAAAEAEERVWWTCGGWTSPNDITTCPDKMTWGLSFDDGPSNETPKLLKYLKDQGLKATFFDVGSRVVSYPDTIRAEYLEGHDICVHTWSHHTLTNMTNEQIVAELGWTKTAIQAVVGITPKCMRAPYGDVDSRVRAIADVMGLRNIIWTRTPTVTFDTNDWQVPGGLYTGPEQFAIFENLLGNATTLDTGFIVLEHDLFIQTVDLAVGYTLSAALTHNPPFTLESISTCQHWAMNDLYNETATKDIVNANITYSSKTAAGPNSSTTSTGELSASGSGNGAMGLLSPTAFIGVLVGAVVASLAGSF